MIPPQDGHLAGRILFQRAHDVGASDDPRQLPTAIDDEHALVTSHRRIVLGDALGQLSNPHRRRHHIKVLRHGLADRDLLQNIGLVVLMNVQAAPRQLLGHDGVLGVAHGNGVGNYRYQHQRQHRVVIARDFEGEDDEGEGRARGRAENRSHRDQRERSGSKIGRGPDLVDDHGESRAHGRAGHEHRRQQAARRARAQRDHQRRRLEDHHRQQRAQQHLGVQDVGDGVVADAQHARHEVADDAQPERADCRPPHVVNRQLLELIFHPIQHLAESQGRDSAEHAQHQIERQRMRQAEVERADLEHRSRPHQPKVNAGGQGAGDDQRNERARLELEQQQLDRENDAGDGRAEGRGHAGRGAAGQQALCARPRWCASTGRPANPPRRRSE